MAFVWEESKFGVRPVEGLVSGEYQGRETVIEGQYSCGSPIVVFADTGERCEVQTDAIHAEFHGCESIEELKAGETSAMAAMLLEAVLLELAERGLLETDESNDPPNPYKDDDLPNWTVNPFSLN